MTLGWKIICIIVLLYLGSVLPQTSVRRFIVELTSTATAETILAAVKGARIVRNYIFGPVHFALLEIDVVIEGRGLYRDPIIQDDLEGINIISDIDCGLEGFRSRAQTDDCFEQEKAGDKYWGLARISRSADLYASRPLLNTSSYKYDTTGQCVNVYVLDSGVNTHHEDFEGRVINGYVVSNIAETEDFTDNWGHGTHVAGIIAGVKSGVAKHAHVISVKVLDKDGRGRMSWLIEGLEWVYQHIRYNTSTSALFVLNLSLGIYDPGYDYEFIYKIFSQIPAVTVAAAGNTLQDACAFVPGRFQEIITVAGTDSKDKLMEIPVNGKLQGTNLGPCVDILAPSHDIVSVSHLGTQQEAMMSGTSQAAAFVSGVVARHLQRMREQPTSQDMLTLLQQTGSTGKINVRATKHPDGTSTTTDLFLHVNCNSSETTTKLANVLPPSIWTFNNCEALRDDNMELFNASPIADTHQTRRVEIQTVASSSTSFPVPTHADVTRRPAAGTGLEAATRTRNIGIIVILSVLFVVSVIVVSVYVYKKISKKKAKVEETEQERQYSMVSFTQNMEKMKESDADGTDGTDGTDHEYDGKYDRYK